MPARTLPLEAFVKALHECTEVRSGKVVPNPPLTEKEWGAWKKRRPELPLPKALLALLRKHNGLHIGVGKGCAKGIFTLLPLDQWLNAEQIATDLDYLFGDEPVPEDTFAISSDDDSTGFLFWYASTGRFGYMDESGITGETDLGTDFEAVLGFIHDRFLIPPERPSYNIWRTTTEPGNAECCCGSNRPTARIVLNNSLYFANLRGPIGSDSGPAGLSVIESPDGLCFQTAAEFQRDSRISQLAVLNRQLVATVESKEGFGLYVSSGKLDLGWGPRGATLLKEFKEPVRPASRFLVVGDKVAMFNVCAEPPVAQLWRTDGTAKGTVLVRAFRHLDPVPPIFWQGHWYFVAGDDRKGRAPAKQSKQKKRGGK